MGKVVGRYIMPHAPVLIDKIGKGNEKGAISTIEGMEKISSEIKELDFDTLIIITPHGHSFGEEHSLLMMESIKGDFKQFGNFDLDYEFQVDMEISKSILALSKRENISIVELSEKSYEHMGFEKVLDHGSLVPLHFINKTKKHFKIVNITFGMASYGEIIRFSKVISEAIHISDKNAIVIASGDLSHKASDDSPYGFDSRGLDFDMKFRDLLSDGVLDNIIDIDDNLMRYSYECGFRSILMMLGTLENSLFKFIEYSYEHPFGIGYMTAKIKLEG